MRKPKRGVAESDLGNPSESGFVLASTKRGRRFWADPSPRANPSLVMITSPSQLGHRVVTSINIQTISPAQISGSAVDWTALINAILNGGLQVGSSNIEDKALLAKHIADAILTTAMFAASIKPVELVDTLPANADATLGRVVFLTTDYKLYRGTGTAWTVVVPTTDLSGTISTAQLAALAVTADKIAANTITAGQIAAGAISATEIAAGAVVAGKIAANAITAAGAEIADATIGSAKIIDASITSAKIGNLEVKSANIENLTVGTGKVATRAITTPVSALGASDPLTVTYPTQQTAVSAAITTHGEVVQVSVAGVYARAVAGNPSGLTFTVKRGATTVFTSAVLNAQAFEIGYAFNFSDTPVAGTYTYYVYVDSNQNSSYIYNRTINLLEVMK
uniref:Putative tail protein n=1 Tax=viral metagenome TaxID=1070528 RepID=A0A6H1ZJA4_9ZZZZ